MKDMLDAAGAASAIATGSGVNGRVYSRVCDRKSDFYPVKQNWREKGADELLPFLKDLESEIFARDKRIVKVIIRLSDSVSDVMMYNSLGELTCETRPMGSVTATAVFQQDGKTENRTASRSFRKGAELICPALVKEMAEKGENEGLVLIAAEQTEGKSTKTSRIPSPINSSVFLSPISFGLLEPQINLLSTCPL